MLTYLCNRVEFETGEQVIAVPFELLRDCSGGNGIVDLNEVVESGESFVVATWNDGLVLCERKYAAQDPPEYHLLPDLAWHTVDERMERMLRSSATHPNRGKKAPNHRLTSWPNAPITTATH